MFLPFGKTKGSAQRNVNGLLFSCKPPEVKESREKSCLPHLNTNILKLPTQDISRLDLCICLCHHKQPKRQKLRS